MDITGIGSVADLAKDIADKIWPDKSDQEKLELQTELETRLGQLKINEAEASNTNWFVAGWRPAIGWVCGAAFAWSFVLAPMISATAYLTGYPITLPTLDLSEMMPVLLGMLGLSTQRSWEKKNNVQDKH